MLPRRRAIQRAGTRLPEFVLVLIHAAIEAALYPVFPPDQAAQQALAWLAENSPS